MDQPSEHPPHSDAPIDIDPIWTTSRTARQIHALGEVEKDISRLLSLAASSISLLTLPQTDSSNDGDNLPQGEERSEQFVLEVSEYFERLDSIQVAIRSSLAHIRHSRTAPSAINAPPPGFLPPSLGVALPPESVPESIPSLAPGVGSKKVGAPSQPKAQTQTQTSTLASTLTSSSSTRGLQEERLDRDAWKGILDALMRLKREMENEAKASARATSV